MKYGKEGQYISLNSAHGISREKVDEAFPNSGESDWRGNIPWELVVRECGVNAVVGRVEIRKQFQDAHRQLTGIPIGDERARQLLRDLPYKTWREIISVVDRAELDAHVRSKVIARTFGKAVRSSAGAITADEFFERYQTGDLITTDPTSGSRR